MKIILKNGKGITLVALVITIIILLILAGISIQALTNQGLFTQAQKANDITKMADAREQITRVLNEWQVEKLTSSTNFEVFFNKKVTENAIDGFEKSDEDGKYNIYKDSYVMVIDAEGNIDEDIQKSGPRPKVSNIKITTDGTTEVLDNSQMPNTKLQINFDSNIINGTIKSVTPAVPYTTNGTETEVKFTIVGTVNGTDYIRTQKVSLESKYKKRQYPELTADKLNVVLSTTENKTFEDLYMNKIVIPAGFKIVSDDTTNNAVTVDKGIVVEDATVDSKGNATATTGSQFVWVPVGKITKTDGSSVTVNLDRYTFDESGKETAQGEETVETYFSEIQAGSGNTVAKSITDFKASVSTNGGYYIGRYEARKNKTSGKVTEVKTDTVWNAITQPNAAIQARNMYDNTHPFTSDLVNSYAWDTAVLFIQNCTNTKYSRQTTVDESFHYTGTTKDVKCNIYDIASNVREWTTETSSYSGSPCVLRGDFYRHSYYGAKCYTSHRCNTNTSAKDDTFGFRPILYL